MGIYKCIVSNFVTMFLHIHRIDSKFRNILWCIRYTSEALTYIAIPFITFVSNNTLMAFSLNLAATSQSFYVFLLNTYTLFLSEILKGISFGLFVQTSVLIFKTYAIANTQTQVQGVRNSAFNGLSCILFGVISFLLISKDLKDPRLLEVDNKTLMMDRVNLMFKNAFIGIFVLLLLSLLPLITARFLKLRNK